MKGLLVIGYWLSVIGYCLFCCPTAVQAQRIIVVSDLHVLSPELMISGGQAFANHQELTPLLPLESMAAIEALTDTVDKYRPDLLLIAGGLTDGGDIKSHQSLLAHLDKIRAKGVTVLVVPGCTDVNNPFAVAYNGDSTEPVQQLTAEEFPTLYADYGYANAISRDPSSLSYAIEPIKGLVLLAIDTNLYDNNNSSSLDDSGAISPATLQWMLQQADNATAKCKQVCILSHHNIIPHFDGQERMLPFDVIKDWRATADTIAHHDIKVVFSGHQYISDIAKHYTDDSRTDSICEIATCSLVSYPCHWRMVTAERNYTNWNVQTHTINATATNPSLTESCRQQFIAYCQNIIPILINQNWPAIEKFIDDYGTAAVIAGLDAPSSPEETISLAQEYFGDLFTELFLIWAEGNEPGNPRSSQITGDFKSQLKKLIRKRSNAISASIIYSIIEPLLDDNVMLWLNSILRDANQYDTSCLSVTDDHQAFFTIPLPNADGIRDIVNRQPATGKYFDLLGRQINHSGNTTGNRQSQSRILIRDGRLVTTK